MTDLFRALSDSTRREILHLTAQKEWTQSDLVAAFTISQPAIKKHLDILLKMDLLLERKEGKYRYYSLNQENYRQQSMRAKLEIDQILEQKLMKLRHFMEEEQYE
ncbi:metalloregulator ArsR/SmtB family transcription factor [Alkalihalobacillus pseudalcaliphilus]|uniref:metalloregulator ArsR/SmtB family transcription factor n=1 Tax=Alkalihalobacillus pseudalcaliphilus TaxID=79884 RepID=UPI00064D7811|nr:metalloregulator ArsR/SmtB family transcription factor [Alkalihalobacillus pseudalcaliphilus]KMK76817.1 hypothetical protein AB990_07885 [Alkalihalobacillus pseudalcaliphilus]